MQHRLCCSFWGDSQKTKDKKISDYIRTLQFVLNKKELIRLLNNVTQNTRCLFNAHRVQYLEWFYKIWSILYGRYHMVLDEMIHYIKFQLPQNGTIELDLDLNELFGISLNRTNLLHVVNRRNIVLNKCYSFHL